MFRKILLFEIQNRIRRPAIYLYFAVAIIFTIIVFAATPPLTEKEHINSPFAIAMWCSGITMMMMLVSSSIMGMSLYRDIEYNTKDYYLTYPITKAGYFWGRYVGSFLCMLFIASAIIIGAYIGTKLGSAIGWTDPKDYGPNKLIYYLHPFFTIVLPNLFFTSSLFFGLVAITRNVKVIYSGGILLFLGYVLSLFFLENTDNNTVINLADPFGLNGIRLLSSQVNSIQKNSMLFPIEGTFLLNRIVWSGVGLAILIYSYIRFNFEKFFSGKRDNAATDDVVSKVDRSIVRSTKVNFKGSYNIRTLFNLTKIELSNIIRDNYFWIILSSGMVLLGFILWIGKDGYPGVPDFPRTAMLFDIINAISMFFIFFIIIFYTGETLHRDRVTRYSFINDSLPPPNWVMNGSKLISILILGASLAFIPAIVAIAVQIGKGFYQFNFPIYFISVFLIILPRLLEAVLFSYVIHVTVNNKFVAHAVGISIWVALLFLRASGTFNYNLLLYSYTPGFRISDMDGIGHMMKAVNSFNLYWLLAGSLLIIVSALFYYRGVTSSLSERFQLIAQRFDSKTRLFTGVLLLAFLTVGAYNYYNVSYLNNFMTKGEWEDRAIIYEKTLKQYQDLPLPKITRIRMYADLYPDKQQAFVKAFVTIVNRTRQPITKLLFDADQLTDYSIKEDGKLIPCSYPLLYSRGMFNWFRPKQDTADFRLYQFQKPLAPGDSAILEFNSSIVHKGFSNGLYAKDLLRNGTFFSGGLPGLGYDDDDEIESAAVRHKNHLPPKEDEEIEQDDPEGISTLKADKSSDLVSMDITVSTSGDQTAIASGELQKQWRQNGRNYFHYVQTKPGLYEPKGILSARFAVLHDSVQLDHKVNISIYYHPEHNMNLQRFVAAYKDGLRYFSSAYGSYPFKDIRLAETSNYWPDGSFTTLDTYPENDAWNADFTNPDQFDYCYFNTVRQLAQQWWRFQVAPNNTVGSLVIPEGLSTYSALIMAEKKYGKANMKFILQDQLWGYLNQRQRMEEKEHPLIRANQSYEWDNKASVALYGLRDLIGEDSMNSALLDFKNAYAFKSKPPFAGSNDLYRFLQKHVPDSLQYYLTDTWQKITFYDNKVTEVRIAPTGNKNEYKVTITVDVAKVWIDDNGNEVPDKNMNDYIDIGVFAANSNNKDGRSEVNSLYLKKYKFTMGLHTITIIVKGKPVNVGVDPYAKLIDRQSDDNMKDCKLLY